MDMVDIGGAAKNGRPDVGSIQTVIFSDNGVLATDYNGEFISDTGGKSADLITRTPKGTPDQKVAKLAQPGATVLYPDAHPAARDDIEEVLFGDHAAIRLKKGQKLSEGIEALGDVRDGYVTGPQGGVVPEAPIPTAAAQAAPAPNPESMERIAKDITGAPIIEVVYHTEVGALASYYHKVVEAGQWLVLIVDNTYEAKQRFIPKPVEGRESKPLQVTVTGSDKHENTLNVLPLGIQFTVDNYDFVVLMIVDGN